MTQLDTRKTWVGPVLAVILIVLLVYVNSVKERLEREKVDEQHRQQQAEIEQQAEAECRAWNDRFDADPALDVDTRPLGCDVSNPFIGAIVNHDSDDPSRLSKGGDVP